MDTEFLVPLRICRGKQEKQFPCCPLLCSLPYEVRSTSQSQMQLQRWKGDILSFTQQVAIVAFLLTCHLGLLKREP